jgi:hypothetical protein
MRLAALTGSEFHQPPPFSSWFQRGESCEEFARGSEEQAIHPNRCREMFNAIRKEILVNSYN